jgi:alpha-glucosidase
LGPVPSVWDQTIALDAKVAEYVMMARRSGKDWYVGALTNENGRKMTVDFSFLPEGKFTLTAWQDGPNANRCGIDYKKITRKVKKCDKLEITLAPGGGWAGRITSGN